MEFILILGAKSDIARALAIVYARHGYNLFLAARNAKELERFASDLQIRYQVEVRMKEFDVTEFSSHQLFFTSLNPMPSGTLFSIGYLGTLPASAKEITEIVHTVEVNITGCATILSVVANEYEKKRTGFIVGISSVAGDRGRTSNYIYGSSKAAVSAFLSGLRNRLHPSKVHVLTVKPGYVRTKMTKDLSIPEKLTSSPEKLAEHIFRSQQKGREVIYSFRIWRLIMLIITHIPEKLFKRLSL